MEIVKVRCGDRFVVHYREAFQGVESIEQTVSSREPIPSGIAKALEALRVHVARAMDCPDGWAKGLEVVGLRFDRDSVSTVATVTAMKRLAGGRSILFAVPPRLMAGSRNRAGTITRSYSINAVAALQQIRRACESHIHGLQFIAAQSAFGFMSELRPANVNGSRALARARYEQGDPPEVLAVKACAEIMSLFEQGRVPFDVAEKALELCSDELTDKMAEGGASWVDDMVAGRTHSGTRGLSVAS